jgi:RecB family endonuclease NucS
MSMLAGAALRKTNDSWEFISEAALEDFVWANLYPLFGLTPLARQHPAKGEYCDILAVNETKQLTIIELKNTQDRYIVQQLTRYYDNLVETKPFSDKIDYNQPVKLIAIKPSFHRHNHIDRKYTKLIVIFLQFTISQNFQLQLQDIDTAQTYSILIPYQKLDIPTISINLPVPPQVILDWLGACSNEEKQAILKMREQILVFDERIQEKIEGKNIIRYFGKSNLVSEIYFQKKINKLVIFLWLPTPSSLSGINKKEVIGRLRLWVDGSKVTDVGHIPEGMGKMKLQSEWDALPREKRPNLMQSLSSKSLIPIPIALYGSLRDNYQISDSLECLTDLALAKWLTKI